MSTLKSLFMTAGTLLVLAPTRLSAQNTERFTVGGERIAVYDLAGEISVVPGTGADVVVEVTRVGQDAGKLRVETSPVRNVEALRIIFPEDRIIYRQANWAGRAEFTVREDGTFGGNDSDRGSRRIQVRSSGEGMEAHANLRVMVPEGKRVSVNIGVGSLNASNVNGQISLDAASADITADRMRGSLNIDTGSGNVTVTTVDGDLSIDTGSGDVKVSGASGTTISIDTGSGNISGHGFTSGHLSVDTGSGNIDMSDVSSPVLSFDTGSGDVDVTLSGDTDDFTIDTGSGDVTVMVPSNFGSAIDLETSSGDVETEVAIQITRQGKQHIIGRIGDGQGRMDVETGSGNVTIRPSR
ncbi:MAG: DUF4097 family beta strand repeat-containing protein [Gemmatimonadota bacterium]